MITLEEYLKALNTVKEYKKQIKKDAKNAEHVESSEDSRSLSDFEIPLRVQKMFGEMYLWNLDNKAAHELDWQACFNMIKISDLRKEPFTLEKLRHYRGFGEKTIIEIRKIYKNIGIIKR